MDAGFSNVSNIDNTFVGHSAGRSNNGGFSNTFVGTNAGYFNLDGDENTLVGMFAGFNNTSGQDNAFFGYQAGVTNTTGSNNTFLGFEAGYWNVDGDGNTFLGRSTGLNSTGVNNVFVGHVAGRDNAGGEGNTYVGTFAAFTVVGGQYLTAFGYNAGAVVPPPGADPLENAFTIGSNSVITRSNSGVLGNASTQVVGGYANWSTASDGRMKADVRQDVKGLDFILALKPVSYRFDAEKLDRFLNAGVEAPVNSRLESGKGSEKMKQQQAVARAAYEKALAAKSQVRYTGFIAQEVETAAARTGFAFSGLVKPANKQDIYSLKYAEFVVPLVKAVQEQQSLITDQYALLEEQLEQLETEKSENRRQQQQLDDMQAELAQLRLLVSGMEGTGGR